MTGTVVLRAFSIVAIGGVVVWRANVEPAPPVFAVVAFDASSSARDRCDGFTGLAERALKDVQKDPTSTLVLLTTGTTATAMEPVRLNPGHLPYDNHAITDDPARKRARRDSFLVSIRRLCESVPPAAVSPVYLVVRRALEFARGQAGASSTRHVLVETDLQETEVPEIRRALLQPRGAPLRNLPSRIDNTGIDVEICGYASTVGTLAYSRDSRRTYTRARTPTNADRLIEVWSAIFTDQLRVRFSPFCPLAQTP